MSWKKKKFGKAFVRSRHPREESFTNLNYLDECCEENKRESTAFIKEGSQQKKSLKKKSVQKDDSGREFVSNVMKMLNKSLSEHVSTLEECLNLEIPTYRDSEDYRINRQLLTVDDEDEARSHSHRRSHNISPDSANIVTRVSAASVGNERAINMSRDLTTLTLVDEICGKAKDNESSSEWKAEKIASIPIEGRQKLEESAKKKVTMKLTSLKVGDIDSTHDRFSADMIVRNSWREPALDCQSFVSPSLYHTLIILFFLKIIKLRRFE